MWPKKILILLLTTCCLQVLQAQSVTPNLKWGKPTNEELNMTEYAADKDADAVVLCHQTSVNYEFIEGNFRVFYRYHVRLKVLKPEGKRVADVSITYFENESNHNRKEFVAGLKATAYNLEDGKLVKTKMERTMVNVERLDKNQMLMKFSVPQVKVGTVIEYEYRIESDYYGDIRDWYAQRDIPVLYTDYELSIPEWFEFNIEETGMNMLEKKDSKGSMSLIFSGETEKLSTEERYFVGRELPALKDDDFVWHAEDYGNKVTAELSGIYIPGAVHKSYTTTWEDIDKLLMEDDDFGRRIKKSSPLKAEIIAAGIPDIADKKTRAAAVWQLLAQKVRWNNDYAFWGKSATKILKEGTGTNADINFLYMNMLQDAGIESTPIMLRIRDHGMLPLSHPSLKYLNTFVVGVYTTDSTMMVMDGSAIDGYLNVLPPRLLVSRARAIRKNKTGYWIDLLAMAQGKEATTIQAQLNSEGLISGRKTSLLTEEAAANLRKTWRLVKDSLEQIHQMQERDGIEIQSYSLEGRSEFSPNMKELMDFTKKCDVAGDLIYLNPFIFIPVRESPFKDNERTLPIEFHYRQSEMLNVILTLPEGYSVEEIPKPIVMKLEGATARIVCNLNNGQLTMQYRLTLDKTFYPYTEYQDLKEFFDNLAERCKDIITIKKSE